MTLSSAVTASLLALSMGAMTLEPQGKTAPGSAKTKAPDVIVTGPSSRSTIRRLRAG